MEAHIPMDSCMRLAGLGWGKTPIPQSILDQMIPIQLRNPNTAISDPLPTLPYPSIQ